MNRPSEVEAIDFKNFHIGTYEGTTTFTTSSGNGVQPMLAIELKNQEGSTQSYETQSGSLTIPNTREGATIKSAILTGQTLVNLAQPSLRNWTMNLNSDTASLKATTNEFIIDWSKGVPFNAWIQAINDNSPVFGGMIKPNTDYTFIINILENSPTFEGVAFTGRVASLQMWGLRGYTAKSLHLQAGVAGTIALKYNFNTVSTATQNIENIFGIAVAGTALDGTKTIDGGKLRISKDIIVLEGDYADNYQDIPYFEGMISCKLPVLTITNGEPEMIENEKGLLVPNPAFKSSTVTIEEPITLRSNGEIYDELDLMTGKYTQRIGENHEVLALPIVRTVKINSDSTFKSLHQADVSMVGDIKATIASIKVPTAPLSFVLDPNNEPDQQFIASEFSITNNSQAPLTVELKEFVQITKVLNDVTPDHYAEWKDLTREESKSIALGLAPQPSENWLSFNPGVYYVAETANATLGRIRSQSTVDFGFRALHGQAFENLPNPQYRLTFVFGF